MMCAVIDTNVLLIANNTHEHASPECVKECVQRLNEIQQGGVVAIDNSYRILGEYQRKTSLNPPKGVGDVFLKWLLRNTGNSEHVSQVAITETDDDTFEEFPDANLQPDFDAPDRKFVAVANAHSDKPPIWQAADCKWLDWWQRLLASGVTVEFICPDDACRYYAKKFPRRPAPALPPDCS